MKLFLSFIALLSFSGCVFAAPQALLDSDLRQIHGAGLDVGFFSNGSDFFQNPTSSFSSQEINLMNLSTSIGLQKDASSKDFGAVNRALLNPILAPVSLTPLAPLVPLLGLPLLPQLPKKSGD